MTRNKRTLQGIVVSNQMDKTIVVEFVAYKRHRLYRKRMRHRSKYLAHDPNNECQIGDEVLIEESRPLSRRKRWRLRAIVHQAAIKPEEEAAPVDSAAI